MSDTFSDRLRGLHRVVEEWPSRGDKHSLELQAVAWGLEEAADTVDELVETLELALTRLAHKAACHTVRPSSEWLEHGSASFDGCSCDRKIILAAIAKARGAA